MQPRICQKPMRMPLNVFVSKLITIISMHFIWKATRSFFCFHLCTHYKCSRANVKWDMNKKLDIQQIKQERDGEWTQKNCANKFNSDPLIPDCCCCFYIFFASEIHCSFSCIRTKAIGERTKGTINFRSTKSKIDWKKVLFARLRIMRQNRCMHKLNSN